MDNILLILQYFAGAGLAFSRGARFYEGEKFFFCVLALAVVSVAHSVLQLVLEDFFVFPDAVSQFRVIKNWRELSESVVESNNYNQMKKRRSTCASATSTTPRRKFSFFSSSSSGK